MTTVMTPIRASCKATMTTINFTRRLRQCLWKRRCGRVVSIDQRALPPTLATARRAYIGEELLTWLAIGYGPCCTRRWTLFEPDLIQRNISLASQTDLHPLHVGLV